MKKLILLISFALLAFNGFSIITISPSALDTAYCKTFYSLTVTASGGTKPYAYTVSSGTLPAGLNLAKSTGNISGTVNLTNDTSITFTVRATDKLGATGTRSYTMIIRNKVLTWQQLVSAWSLQPNTFPSYSQVYDTWRNSANSSNSWMLNGNTTGATKSIGTIDNQDFKIKTNNTDRFLISKSGYFLFGDSISDRKTYFRLNLDTIGLVSAGLLNLSRIRVDTSTIILRTKHIDIGYGAPSYWNISMGIQAGVGYQDNLSIGSFANHSMSESVAVRNCSLGMNAGITDSSGNANVNIGVYSGYWNKIGNSNTNVGTLAGQGTLSSNNVYVGNQSGSEGAGGGGSNTGVGDASLVHNNSTGNTAIGNGSFATTTTGGFNFGGGYGSGFSNITGQGNSYVGRESGYSATGANYNSSMGMFSGYSMTGDLNTTFGAFSGWHYTTGSNNLFIGSYSGQYGSGSNRLFIDNTDRVDSLNQERKSLIVGTFGTDSSNQSLRVNGSLSATGIPTDTSSLKTGDFFNVGGILHIKYLIDCDYNLNNSFLNLPLWLRKEE